MAVSYKKLWKLLIDKEMMKKDLRAMTGVSTTTMSRLSKDENVSTEILSKICWKRCTMYHKNTISFKS